jgi:hypothetical protein
MCGALTTASNNCIKSGSTAIVANTKKVYLNVSVWSAGTSAAGIVTDA